MEKKSCRNREKKKEKKRRKEKEKRKGKKRSGPKKRRRGFGEISIVWEKMKLCGKTRNVMRRRNQSAKPREKSEINGGFFVAQSFQTFSLLARTIDGSTSL
ncbi:hypothetical protein ACOSQ3_021324 [Xanthoceras sorbifolium]